MNTILKILFITPRFPYPPLTGDQVVSYHRLRILGKRHEITLLSFYEKDEELAGIEQLSPFCHAIHTVRLPKWRSLLNVALMGPFSGLPLQVLYYHSAAFQKRLTALLDENRFDLIHAYMLRVAPYLSAVSTPKILELIDSMQFNLERRVTMEGIPNRWLFTEELRRVTPYERKIGELFDQLIVVSEKDKALIPSNNVRAIPLGVDTDIFVPREPQDKLEQKPIIVFSGNMGYAPNIHAVTWFVEKCLPLIQKAIPDAALIIAGSNPSKEVRDLGQKRGVTVTGFVESMSEILNKARVAVAPMQSGSGMQFKILEAMACGLPVVATTLGLGDIKARPGHDIYIADTAGEFAEMVLNLLNTPETAERISRQARNFVLHNHSWEHMATQVEAIYHKILGINRLR
jgi:sugar transferase (PEP-CTERM/EpsH1 system associated)